MKKLQRGFSIVTAIFLLVVLAGLGAAMLTFSNVQHQSSALDVLGSRAYHAARAGIEWAAYGVTQGTTGVKWTGCATGANFPQNSLGGTLAPFTVTVSCAATSHVVEASTVWVYDVNAVANTGTPGGADYVERAISTKMGK